MKKDWQLEKLGDVIKLEYGKPLQKKDRLQGGKYPAYGANGIKCWTNEYYFDKKSLIVGRKGSAGEVNYTTERFWPLDVTYFVTYDNTKYDLDFLYHCLKFLQLPKLAKGVKPGINRNDVYRIIFSFPSLSEQKRIVAILDDVFARIDDAIANTEKNLTNARELFESYLSDVFSRKGKGWIEKKLSTVVEPDCSLSYGIVQPGKEYEGGLPVARPTDLKAKTIHLSNLKRIDPLLADSYQRTKLNGGELLLCVRGSTGVVSIAADELKGSNVTRGIVPIRFDQELVYQSFGYYMLISKPIQDQIKEQTYGAALMQINIRDLRKVLVFFPKQQEEQQILIKKLSQIEEKAQRLEAIYQQKLTALNELKQSILQKAFTGELTADTASQAKEAKEEIAA